jgi:hypothetical protein
MKSKKAVAGSDGDEDRAKEAGFERQAKWGTSMREVVEGEAKGASSNIPLFYGRPCHYRSKAG